MQTQHAVNGSTDMEYLVARHTVGPGDPTAVNNSPVNSQRNADLEVQKTGLRVNKRASSINCTIDCKFRCNLELQPNEEKERKVYEDVSKHINMILSGS